MRGTMWMVAASIALAGCATNESDSAPASWGKANVALVDYWNDAAQCALAGATAGRKETAPTVGITRQSPGPAMEETNGAAEGPTTTGLNDTLMRARLNVLERRRAEDAARQAAIDTCLTDRGYRRFRLTADQEAHLQSLPEGSLPRREYLHSLASSPGVLSTQGI